MDFETLRPAKPEIDRIEGSPETEARATIYDITSGLTPGDIKVASRELDPGSAAKADEILAERLMALGDALRQARDN